MYLIDFTQGKLLPRPSADRPGQKEMFYPCLCVRCQRTRWLRKWQALHATQCRSCHSVDAGKKGYATLKATGHKRQIEGMKKHQREKPSREEKIVRDWLNEWGITYDDQHTFQFGDGSFCLIDFVIGDLAIEIRGYWHYQTKASKDAALIAKWGGSVLFIEASDMRGAERIKQVKAALCAVVTAKEIVL